MKSAAQILRDAKALIGTPDKWCKFSQYNEDGARCVHGAICKVVGTETYEPVNMGAWRYLGEVVGWPSGRGQGIAVWNNAPTTTHAHVMAAFDKAIALAEKEELPKHKRESDESYTHRVLQSIVAGARQQEVTEPK